jgi:putative membrane protein (TIGR04086 family)
MNPIPRVSGFRAGSPMLSGLMWAVIWLGAGTLLLSVLLAGTSLRESDLTPWVFGVHGFAAAAGGFVAARKSGRKGLYTGALTGIVYTLAVLLTSYLAVEITWSARIPALLGVTGLTGGLGGMFGVNTGPAGSARR